MVLEKGFEAVFQVDSGATVNVVPVSMMKHIDPQGGRHIKSYLGQKVSVVGHRASNSETPRT